MPSPIYTWSETENGFLRPGLPPLVYAMPQLNAESWSDTNSPAQYQSTNEFEAGWPAGLIEVPLEEGGGDLLTDLKNTVAPYAATARVMPVCDKNFLHYHDVTEFPMIGSSNDPKYAMTWDGRAQGWKGMGEDKCRIRLKANSVGKPSRESKFAGLQEQQLTQISQMLYGSMTDPLQMSVLRFDARTDRTPPGNDCFISGVGFEAEYQQNINSFSDPNLAAAVNEPVPCPHQGLTLYAAQVGAKFRLNRVAFYGFGTAITSQPPGEMANCTSFSADIIYDGVLFDCRAPATIDPDRKAKCGPVMLNKEYTNIMGPSATDRGGPAGRGCRICWSSLSRYAMNASGGKYDGTYVLRDTRVDNIHTVDNYGRGGFEGYPSLIGFESFWGQGLVEDCYLSVDTAGQKNGVYQYHLSLTIVGQTPSSGSGKFIIRRTKFRHTKTPYLDGFFTARIVSNTPWYTSGGGLAENVEIYHPVTGNRLTAYTFTGNYPSQATLQAANITSNTHYLVRTN